MNNFLTCPIILIVIILIFSLNPEDSYITSETRAWKNEYSELIEINSYVRENDTTIQTIYPAIDNTNSNKTKNTYKDIRKEKLKDKKHKIINKYLKYTMLSIDKTIKFTKINRLTSLYGLTLTNKSKHHICNKNKFI